MADPDTRARGFLGIICTLTGIAAVLVGLRLWARGRIVRNVGSDDYVVLLSLALVFGALGCLITSCHYGLGMHAYDLAHWQEATALKFLWIAFNLTPAAEITAKISITLMLMKVTTSRIWKRIFILLIITSICITIASNFTFLLSCHPLPKLWDSEVAGECNLLGRNTEVYFQGVTAAIYDLVLAFAPIFILWNVQISFKDKLLLCGLFALGCFTAAAGIIRITMTNVTSWSNDPTWEVIPFVIWKCVELDLSIIVGCLPTLRPLLNPKKHLARYSVRLQDGYSGYPRRGFAIHKTTEIYVRSTDADSAGQLRDDWEMKPVTEISYGAHLK